MGGSDQWGNIVTGTELIRRKAGGEAFAITAPLVTKADGSKFGKSEGGNVWLDRNKTSPYKFYQFWLNVSDNDASKFIRIYTLLSQVEITKLESDHQKSPHFRILQKALAAELTRRVHSESDLHQAIRASEVLFGKSGSEELDALEEDLLLEVLEGVNQVRLNENTSNHDLSIIDLLSEATGFGIFKSKSEARRMLESGGIGINKVKVALNTPLSDLPMLKGKYYLVQVGKKNYHLIIVE